MNRIEALDRYSFSSRSHNIEERESVPKSYEEFVLGPFIERIKARKNPIVLDLASGMGKASAIIESAGIKTVRSDISIKALKISRRTGVRAIFDGLPFRSKSFDAIHFKDGLVHAENRIDLFENLFRILKPGGELLIISAEYDIFRPFFRIHYKKGGSYDKSFGNENDYIEELRKMKRKGQTKNRKIDPPYYPLRKVYITNELTRAGFQTNSVSSWKPHAGEKDWYSFLVSRYVFSATKPSAKTISGVLRHFEALTREVA